MNHEEAIQAIGKMVLTTHAGDKLVRSGPEHGPYKLLKVTKAGVCILEGYEEYRVSPTLIELCEETYE